MQRMRAVIKTFFLAGSVLCFAFPALAQDSNILLPIAEIEQKLEYDNFEIFRFRPSRFEGDITKRAILRYPENQMLQVKWKRSAKGGGATNNEPRYEVAAYEIQKLFLDPQDYVVPPTVCRCMPLDQYRHIEKRVPATFKNSSDVFYVLQYWLNEVGTENVFDKKRFDRDSTYARHLANVNILSYLIKHNDANIGNFLVSTDPKNPRVFAVDNGFAFGSLESNRGFEWRNIRVKRLPGQTVERLRNITLEDLSNTLGVVAQFEIQNGHSVPVDPTENLDKKKGVRRSGNIIQFGLKKNEINGVHDRLKRLLRRIDSGKIKTF